MENSKHGWLVAVYMTQKLANMWRREPPHNHLSVEMLDNRRAFVALNVEMLDNLSCEPCPRPRGRAGSG